ncbi:MAG: FkbM family methyltransferase [Pyrinomonadaceae bacterium]
MTIDIQQATARTPAAERLERLLAESPETARRRSSSVLDLREGDALVLYGAGTLGRAALAGLRAAGVEPAAFADDTPGKEGQIIDGVPVMKPRTAAERFGAHTLFVVTILNPALSFVEARRRLQASTGARVASFLSLAWQFPQSLLPHYQYVAPQEVLAQAAEIRRAFDVWADEKSRTQFVAHIEFRLRADYDALPEGSGDNYFPRDVPLALTDETTFVDCGAYDGDTVRRFLAERGGRFREIYAFEPDAANYRRLREYVAALDAGVSRRLHVFHAGVGRRRERLSFNATGDTGASFGGAGGIEVDVLPIQDVVATGAGESVYVKYDVEGAELEALEGTRGLIARARAALAVSVYHKPGDLWELPLYLASLGAGYSLYFRTQGADGMDAICYAVPPPVA